MPVSGQITYEGYTLFLLLPMVELRQGHPLLQMLDKGTSLGFLFDPEAEGATDFVDLIPNNMAAFVASLRESVPPGMPMVGIVVWEGGGVVQHDGEVTFEGTVRRPTPEDFAHLAEFTARMDSEAQEQFMEHALHCHDCAKRAGIEPIDNSQGGDDEDDEDDEESHHPPGIWVVGRPGEA